MRVLTKSRSIQLWAALLAIAMIAAGVLVQSLPAATAGDDAGERATATRVVDGDPGAETPSAAADPTVVESAPSTPGEGADELPVQRAADEKADEPSTLEPSEPEDLEPSRQTAERVEASVEPEEEPEGLEADFSAAQVTAGCAEFHFIYVSGAVDKGWWCGQGNDAKQGRTGLVMDPISTNYPDLFATEIHLSCSVNYLTTNVPGTGMRAAEYYIFNPSMPPQGGVGGQGRLCGTTPELELVKAADGDEYTVGETVTYTYTVRNRTIVPLRNLTLTDDVLGTLTDNLGTRALEEKDATTTATATHLVTSADAQRGSIHNTATVTGFTPTNLPVRDIDDETVQVVGAGPAIALVKTGVLASGSVEPGRLITYTFDVENTGNVPLTNVRVTDPLLGSGSIAVTPSTLAPNETATATATYPITQADINAGGRDNTATAHGTPPSGADVTHTDNESVPLTQSPAISLEKTGVLTGTGAITPGRTITYTFGVENTGNVPLTNVRVTDPLFIGQTFQVTPSTLAPNERGTATATYAITQSDINAGGRDNTATAHGTPPSGADVTHTDDETVLLAIGPAISLVKTGVLTGSGVVSPGRLIAYTFVVSNTGNVPLTNVRVSDPLFIGQVFAVTPSTLAPNETGTVTATYAVTQSDINAGRRANTATAHGTPPSGGDVTDTDDALVPLAVGPSILLEKNATLPAGAGVGSQVPYTFRVTNTGNVTLTDVVLTDAMLGLTGGSAVAVASSMSPGQVIDVAGTFTHTLTQADMDRGFVSNTATVEGRDPGGNPVRDDDTEIVSVSPGPRIRIVKSGPVEASVGDTITYSFTITNIGTVTLTAVRLSDARLGIAQQQVAGSLAPGQAITVTRTYTVTAADGEIGQVFNTAVVVGTPPTGPDVTHQDSHTVAVDTPVSPVGSILLEKTGSTATATQQVGDLITYEFRVTNTGPVTLTNVFIVDELLGFTGSPLSLTVNPSTLPPGAVGTATATYAITQADLDVGEVFNTATVVGTDPEGRPVRDTDDENVGLTPVLGEVIEPDIELVKTGVAAEGAGVGDEIAYTFLVTNSGNVRLSNVRVDDPLLGQGMLSVTPSTLEPGDSGTATGRYTITQADMDRGFVFNEAIGRGTPPQGPDVTDRDDDTVELDETPVLPRPPIEPPPSRTVPTPAQVIARTGADNPMQLLAMAALTMLMGAGLLVRHRQPSPAAPARQWQNQAAARTRSRRRTDLSAGSE